MVGIVFLETHFENEFNIAIASMGITFGIYTFIAMIAFFFVYIRFEWLLKNDEKLINIGEKLYKKYNK